MSSSNPSKRQPIRSFAFLLLSRLRSSGVLKGDFLWATTFIEKFFLIFFFFKRKLFLYLYNGLKNSHLCFPFFKTPTLIIIKYKFLIFATVQPRTLQISLLSRILRMRSGACGEEYRWIDATWNRKVCSTRMLSCPGQKSFIYNRQEIIYHVAMKLALSSSKKHYLFFFCEKERWNNSSLHHHKRKNMEQNIANQAKIVLEFEKLWWRKEKMKKVKKTLRADQHLR